MFCLIFSERNAFDCLVLLVVISELEKMDFKQMALWRITWFYVKTRKKEQDLETFGDIF
ncbi:hypothetical protein Syun_028125 [Stephania yunnanensis]|uniref:Uncharacterized protein n=1 Tax=Stephania yunnanensis TaxID=152371 RepID=A0AAP0EH62_9MAGN